MEEHQDEETIKKQEETNEEQEETVEQQVETMVQQEETVEQQKETVEQKKQTLEQQHEEDDEHENCNWTVQVRGEKNFGATDFFLALRGLSFISLIIQYYSAICRPSDHTVERTRAEIRTRYGRSRGWDTKH